MILHSVFSIASLLRGKKLQQSISAIPPLYSPFPIQEIKYLVFNILPGSRVKLGKKYLGREGREVWRETTIRTERTGGVR